MIILYFSPRIGNCSCCPSCADSEGGAGGPDPPPPPLKNHQNIGFHSKKSNTGPDPMKNHKAAKPAFICTPAKSHLMAFRSRADDGLLIAVYGFSLPLSLKKKTRCKSWTPSDKTFWIRACP